MIFIFGLITGFMFDMPIWWWILGFIIGIFDIMTTPSGNIYYE